MRLIPSDYYEIRAQCADDTYFWYRDALVLKKMTISTKSEDATRIFTGTTFYKEDTTTALTMTRIDRIFITSTTDMMFMTVENNADQYFLYKSVDDGVSFGNNSPAYDNFAAVDGVGDDGTHIADVSILGTRGFLEHSDGTFYYGDYNTNGAKTPGSTNDRVTVSKSTDNGDTWTQFVILNTDGSTTQVSHCHAVLEDPYTNNIFICFGDGNNSGMLAWDGTGAYTANTEPLNASTLDGWDGVGQDEWNSSTDLIFTSDWIYQPADNQVDGTDKGVFRFKRDFSQYELINTDIDTPALDNHAYYWHEKIGQYFVSCEIIQVGATDSSVFIWGSPDGGTTWENLGYLVVETQGSAVSPEGFFAIDDTVYISSGSFAGKSNLSMCSFTITDETISEPDILHPVYFVDSSGDNANDGFTLGNAFKTLEYAMEGDRATFGARILLSAGYHESPAADIVWNGNAFGSDTTKPVIIEGVQGQTWLSYDTGNAGQGVTLQAGDGDVTFRNMRVFSLEENPFTLDDGYDGTLKENVTIGKINWR